MSAPIHDYHFVSTWEVEGTVDEVADVLGDPMARGEESLGRELIRRRAEPSLGR